MKLVYINKGIFKDAEFSDKYKPGYDILVIIHIKDGFIEYSNFFKPYKISLPLFDINEVIQSVYESIESNPDGDFLAIGNSIIAIDSIYGIDVMIKPDNEDKFSNKEE